jgi:hypothetical protein
MTKPKREAARANSAVNLQAATLMEFEFDMTSRSRHSRSKQFRFPSQSTQDP